MLYLFGVARHETQGRFDTKKPTALLLYLAASGTWVDRENLATLLWADTNEAKAKSSLRQALYVLKKEWGEQLELEAGRVRFEVVTDLSMFKEALLASDYEQAIALASSVFLVSYQTGIELFDEWLALERATLNELWRDAVLRFVRVGQAPTNKRIDCLLSVLEREPLAEEVVQELLKLANQATFHDTALGVYRRFSSHLKAELDLEPLDETKALVERLRQDPLIVEAPSRLNQKPLTPFVGRDLELTELSNMLERSTSLVTLLGQGGVGKTRLALQLLVLKQPVFKDGAAFVALSAAQSAEDILYEIARSLGLALNGNEPTFAQLGHYLKSKSLLLVLDNFEHLAGHATLLNQLLAAAPDLKYLVTSRNKLNLSVEQVFKLEGLSYSEALSEEAFTSSDAVQFFLRTLKRLDPGFQFNIEEREAVLRICQSLEGLPLGLELSASWLPVMTLAEIAEELEQSLDLLQSSQQDSPERHKSLAAVFEYSWVLLSEAEQTILAALSVFVGGFDQQAIRAVTGASRLHLLSLINKSLLQRVQPAYFDLHALVKQYAEAKLSEERKADLKKLHEQYFLEELLVSAEDLKGSLVQEALDRIAQDIMNIQKAYYAALPQLELSVLVKASWALRRFYELRARFSEGIHFFETSLVPCNSAEKTAAVQAVQSWLLQCTGRYPEAIALAQKSLTQAGLNESIRLEALQALGASRMRLGHFESAKETYEEGFSLAKKLQNSSFEASLGSNLGLLYQRLADYDQALRYMKASLASFRKLKDNASITTLLNNIADVLLSQERPKEALVLLNEGAELSKKGEFWRLYPYLLFNQGRAYTLLEQSSKALKPLNEALSHAKSNKDPYLEAWVEQALAEAFKVKGLPKESQEHLLASLVIAVKTQNMPLTLDNLLLLATMHLSKKPIFASNLLNYIYKHPQALEIDRINAKKQLADKKGYSELQDKDIKDVIKYVTEQLELNPATLDFVD